MTRVTADGTPEVINNGVAGKSVAVQATTSNAGSTANSVVATLPQPMRNAYGYAWYVGAPGAEMLAAITDVCQFTVTAMPTVGQAASALTGGSDTSRNSLIFDGLLTMASDPSNGSYYKAATPGASLTPSGDGGIVEFDDVLQYFWEVLQISPSSIWYSGQEVRTVKSKILGGDGKGNARFSFNVQQGQITGGGNAKGYLNPYASGNGPSEIPLIAHPTMPHGTVLFMTSELPYALNNVNNILQIRTRQEYHQTEWPRRTRKYEAGVYVDEVLQNFFMPGMALITGLSK